jgi:hypothetical protein
MNIFLIAVEQYLKQNKYFQSIENIDEYSKFIYDTYSNKCDLQGQLKQMNCWLEINPKRRKKNYKRFINSWLSRSARR